MIETLLGQLPITRRRRSAVVVLSTLGVVLLVAAFPFHYSRTRLSVLWLLEAEALLLIGVWTKKLCFAVAAAVTCGQMVSVEAAQIYDRRLDGADLRPNFALAVVFVVAAAVFYANADRVIDLRHASFVPTSQWTPVNKTAATIIFLMGIVAFQESRGTGQQQDCEKRMNQELHPGTPLGIAEATLKKCGFKTTMDLQRRLCTATSWFQGTPVSERTQVLINLDSDNRVATVTVTTGLIGP